MWNYASGAFEPSARAATFISPNEMATCENYQKMRFPPSFFPESRWSRKGFMRTRWSLGVDRPVEMVNVHIFHDASNLESVKSAPSVYAKNRARALWHILGCVVDMVGVGSLAWPDAQSHEKTIKLPEHEFIAIFGDFNFRLSVKLLVDQLFTTYGVEGTIESEADEAIRRIYKKGADDEPLLTIEAKVFAAKFCGDDSCDAGEQPSAELTSWMNLRKFDVEFNAFDDLLHEYERTFPPTYPYCEAATKPNHYAGTRAPSWCDRVLISRAGLSAVDSNKPITYDTIGKDTCMGDHKPVFLRLTLADKC